MHVTVLIPLHNREPFIGEAIDSVIAQDYDDWDLLIVDSSTDESLEVVRSRISDNRIAIIQTKDKGLSTATAIGIEHARGPVVTVLDSDDKLMPNSLSSVMPAFEKNRRLGYVWTEWIDSTGNRRGDSIPCGKTFLEALTSPNFHYSHQKFFRKEYYLQTELLDTSIKYCEDLQLAFLIGKTGCDTLHIPKVTYWQRIHARQITKDRSVEVSECARMVRRKFCSQDAALAEQFIVTLEKENDALSNELNGIRRCFGYRVMRLYGSIIDGALPDDTRRGKLKRKVVDRIRGS
jgi:hypothetical protein